MKYEVLIVIQARYGSQRLLGKVLLPLGGVPLLAYLIRRLKVLPSSWPIVVATTDKREDNRIAACAEKEGVAVIRGEDEDVLARYIRCLKAFPAPVVVRVTADNPLTEPDIIKDAVRILKRGGYDYVNAVKNYPIGMGVDVFTKNLLHSLDKMTSSPYEREHINAHVLNHPHKFKIGELACSDGLNSAGLRLTVDTNKDYIRVKNFVEVYPKGYFIRMEDAIEQAYKRNI